MSGEDVEYASALLRKFTFWCIRPAVSPPYLQEQANELVQPVYSMFKQTVAREQSNGMVIATPMSETGTQVG